MGLRPTPVRVTSLPGTSRPPTRKKAAEEKSAGTEIRPGSRPLGGADGDRALLAGQVRPGRRQHALGVVPGRERLEHPGLALGQHPGEEQARLHLGARHRQLVRDAAQGRALDAQRRQPRPPGRRARRPSGAAARRSGRPGGAGSRRRRQAPTRPPGCPASQPGSSRSSVPALPTSIRASLAPRSPTPITRISGGHPVGAVDPCAPMPPPPPGSSGCRRSRESPRSPPRSRPSRQSAPPGGRSTCRAGGASAPRSGPAGSKRVAVEVGELIPRPGRSPSGRAPRSSRPRAAPARRPTTQSETAPELMSGAG